jgi:hypothetical protein
VLRNNTFTANKIIFYPVYREKYCKKRNIYIFVNSIFCILLYAEQKRYTNFIIESLLHDLSVLFPEKNKNNLKILTTGKSSFSPPVENIAKHYPVIKKIIPINLGNNTDTLWINYYYIFAYYNFGDKNFIYKKNKKFPVNMPRIFNSYYYSIYSDEEHALVEFKN